jgi:hypothetical protein
MNRQFTLITLLLLLMTVVSLQVQAQEMKEAEISIYRIAPGKHLDFLKWQAEVQAVQAEAGVPATQWYAHLDGDSWDYLSIGPILTDEQEKKVEELQMKKGMPTGFKGGLKFRQFISSHTDTTVAGPTTPAELVKSAE